MRHPSAQLGQETHSRTHRYSYTRKVAVTELGGRFPIPEEVFDRLLQRSDVCLLLLTQQQCRITTSIQNTNHPNGISSLICPLGQVLQVSILLDAQLALSQRWDSYHFREHPMLILRTMRHRPTLIFPLYMASTKMKARRSVWSMDVECLLPIASLKIESYICRPRYLFS